VKRTDVCMPLSTRQLPRDLSARLLLSNLLICRYLILSISDKDMGYLIFYRYLVILSRDCHYLWVIKDRGSGNNKKSTDS